jgi:hypothetical protein
MPRRLVLHAGPHKTGTTALQAAFAREAARLSEAGVLYPATGRQGTGHHALAEACRTGETALLGALAREARGADTVLVSSENFAHLDADALARLRAALPAAEVVSVYVLRRLAALWPSHWREMIKHGQSFGFADYMLPAVTGDLPPFVGPPLPPRQVGALTAAFGGEGLRLPVYDAHRGAEHDLGVHFARTILDRPDASAFATVEMNVTPPDWETETLRLCLARVEHRLDYAGRMRVREALLAHLRATPPDWLSRLRAAVADAPRIRLTERSPLVEALQTAVVARHGSAFLDPAEDYLAPITVEFPAFEPRMLTERDRADANRLFDRLAGA